MKAKKIKGLLFIPFVVIYLALFVLNIVYDINLVYNIYTILLWCLFLIYMIIHKRKREGNDYFTISMFVVTVILLVANMIRRL